MSGSQTAIRSLATALALVVSLPVAAQTIDFREAGPGAPPAGFEFATTGAGSQGRWEAIRDASATGGTALAQLSTDATSYRFPLALHAAASAANVQVTVRFKPISGKVDQAGGIVVRYRDPNNYYVARANALENNVRFYRVLQGKREQLATADVKVAPGEWHTLALRAEGDRFTVSFNDRVLYSTNDRTFGAAGKVGLWTKADSVTHFDNLDIKILP